MAEKQDPQERLVTLTLPHSQMCLARACVNFAEGALSHMPASLGPQPWAIDGARELRQSRAWDEAFDKAAAER